MINFNASRPNVAPTSAAAAVSSSSESSADLLISPELQLWVRAAAKLGAQAAKFVTDQVLCLDLLHDHASIVQSSS